MAQDDDKAELIAELARSRTRLTDSTLALRRDLDFPTRAKNAFKKSPLPWIGGAALVGLIIARLPGKKTTKLVVARKSKDSAMETAGKAGLILSALKIAFDFARPTLLNWATQRFSDYVTRGQTQDFRPR